ncbi:MAG TPA: hypothetical protein PKO06_25075, partial [Candidatus Ozemobacteraceae bacterium]|nr:hypothetical protein [Candidatus Ozemobacteraceae bacterium]
MTQALPPKPSVEPKPVSAAAPTRSVTSNQVAAEPATGLCRDIDVLIRARYPILYVVTHEEERAEFALFQIARAQNKQCLSWSVTRGLMPTGTDMQSKKKISEMTRDPLAALESVVENLEHALFIFKDFHPYLQDTTIIRKVRELAGFLRDSPRTLIFISPVLRIPTELEKEITVLEFGLPMPKEIAQKLDEMVDQVKDNPKVSISLTQEDREKLVKACTGLTLREVENVLAKTIISTNQ